MFTQQIRFRKSDGSHFSDWKEKKLGEIATKKASSISANTLNENEGTYKIYGATGVLKQINFYREDTNYIAIVKDGAGVGRLLLCEANSSVLGTLDIVRNNELTNLHFLFYLLGTVDFSKYITGSTIPHIYFKDYAKEQILLPNQEEQNLIAAFLLAIDEKIETEQKIAARYEQQKSYLLQNLFI